MDMGAGCFFKVVKEWAVAPAGTGNVCLGLVSVGFPSFTMIVFILFSTHSNIVSISFSSSQLSGDACFGKGLGPHTGEECTIR